jgi:hypothetical protein
MDFDPPGDMMDKAKQMARDVMANVKQRYEGVKTAYRVGNEETVSLGKELEATRQMKELGRQGIKDVLPSYSEPPKGK